MAILHWAEIHFGSRYPLGQTWNPEEDEAQDGHGPGFGRTRQGRATPFLTDPEQNQCGKCGRLEHNSRTCHWPLSQVKITNTKKLFICSYKTNLYFLIIFCRMEPFHLLEPYYEENHRGRLTAEGEVTTLLLFVIFPLHMYLCSRINIIICILCRN